MADMDEASTGMTITTGVATESGKSTFVANRNGVSANGANSSSVSSSAGITEMAIMAGGVILLRSPVFISPGVTDRYTSVVF
jgi:hypothetical protein